MSGPQETSKLFALDTRRVVEIGSCVALHVLNETVGLEPTAGRDTVTLIENAL